MSTNRPAIQSDTGVVIPARLDRALNKAHPFLAEARKAAMRRARDSSKLNSSRFDPLLNGIYAAMKDGDEAAHITLDVDLSGGNFAIGRMGIIRPLQGQRSLVQAFAPASRGHDPFRSLDNISAAAAGHAVANGAQDLLLSVLLARREDPYRCRQERDLAILRQGGKFVEDTALTRLALEELADRRMEYQPLQFQAKPEFLIVQATDDMLRSGEEMSRNKMASALSALKAVRDLPAFDQLHLRFQHAATELLTNASPFASRSVGFAAQIGRSGWAAVASSLAAVRRSFGDRLGGVRRIAARKGDAGFEVEFYPARCDDLASRPWQGPDGRY